MSDPAIDARLVGLTLELAAKGEGQTHPNPMVGAVVARGGEIAGTGFHVRAGLEHAESIALTAAGDAASGATLYTNLEPCSHQGRTPPCVEQIIRAGVRRVVCGVRDPNPLVNGRGFQALRAAGIEVVSDVLAEECARLNRAFFRHVTTGRPWVTVKAACSLDGRIAAAGRGGEGITGPESRAEAMRLRARHDAVLVGVGTVLLDDPRLTVRAPAEPRPILRAVVDSALRTPPASQLARLAAEAPLVIYHTERAEARLRKALESTGAQCVAAGTGPSVSLDAALADLGRRDVMSLLVEGGGALIGSFLRESRADELHLFVAPIVLGDRGVPLAGGWSAARAADALRVGGLSVRRFGGDLHLSGTFGEA